MPVRLNRSDLSSEYNYSWARTEGDAPYIGILDRVLVNKSEGYEVLYFLESFINENDLTRDDVLFLENILHQLDTNIRSELQQQLLQTYDLL